MNTKKIKVKAEELNRKLRNSWIWKPLSGWFKKCNGEITDEMIELYVYVLDEDGPDEFSALGQKYQNLIDITDLHLSEYKSVNYTVEALLKKMLYMIDYNALENYRAEQHNGLKSLLKPVQLVDKSFYIKILRFKLIYTGFIFGQLKHFAHKTVHFVCFLNYNVTIFTACCSLGFNAEFKALCISLNNCNWCFKLMRSI